MKTALFAPLFLNGLDLSGSNRYRRNIRWLEWYKSIKGRIGFDDIWMCDNGSHPPLLSELIKEHQDINIIRYPHLERTDIPNGYGYCWRALWAIRALVGLGYDKIITADSDSFVVSGKLADFIKGCDTGWQSFMSKKYSFPTAELHILTRNAFPIFLKYTEGYFSSKIGVLMETNLPFTKIHTEFDCDRYGEDRQEQLPKMDGYFQAPTDLPLIFRV